MTSLTRSVWLTQSMMGVTYCVAIPNQDQPNKAILVLCNGINSLAIVISCDIHMYYLVCSIVTHSRWLLCSITNDMLAIMPLYWSFVVRQIPFVLMT